MKARVMAKMGIERSRRTLVALMVIVEEGEGQKVGTEGAI